MKINFLLLTIIIAAISGCSTSYRTGQTPDDVYYSPARLQTDEVRRDREENNTVDNTVYTSSEDREIRRRVYNRRNRRHNRYDRYDDRYDYPYGYGYPAYGKPTYGLPQNTQQPRKTNLGAYTPNSTTPDSSSFNPKTGKINTGTSTAPVRTFGTPSNSSSNSGTGVGNLIRKVFSTDNSYNSGRSGNSSPSRTFDNSSSSSSRTLDTRSSSSNNSSSSTSTPSSSSSSAPVRTFKKDN